jgi:DNA-binding IscR family transcriptional regulator
MKLTAKGRYAVMAMADLATFNKQQNPKTPKPQNPSMLFDVI